MEIHNHDPVRRLYGLFDRLDEAERAWRTARAGKAPESRGCRAAGDTVGPARDGVAASARAREIAGLRRAIARLPDVRPALVARLRAQIASGLYRADGRRIAAAMLDEDRALGARPATRRP